MSVSGKKSHPGKGSCINLISSRFLDVSICPCTMRFPLDKVLHREARVRFSHENARIELLIREQLLGEEKGAAARVEKEDAEKVESNHCPVKDLQL